MPACRPAPLAVALLLGLLLLGLPRVPGEQGGDTPGAQRGRARTGPGRGARSLSGS